jgi:hypothetical protein
MIVLRGFVTLRSIGFHCWPNAPDAVAYLRDRHRHNFYFKIEFDVAHADREIEYHLFQAWAQRTIDGLMTTLPDSASCENIAEALLIACHAEYGARSWIVTISEDDENGAIAQDLLNSSDRES